MPIYGHENEVHDDDDDAYVHTLDTYPGAATSPARDRARRQDADRILGNKCSLTSGKRGTDPSSRTWFSILQAATAADSPRSFLQRPTPHRRACMKATTRTPNSQLHFASASSRHVPEDHHSHNVHHQHLPSESGPKSTSFTATFRSVFQRLPSRAPSAASLHSSYSAASSPRPQPPPPASDYKPIHPYATMVSAPLPVVSSHDAAAEDECPVCLEPLSFSFRLPGEKPHIVPECGHALHEVSLSLLAISLSSPIFPSPPSLLPTSPARACSPSRSSGHSALQVWPWACAKARGASRRALCDHRLQSVQSCFYEVGGHLRASECR